MCSSIASLIHEQGRGATAMAEMTATAIARETGETIVDARKRIWLCDSQV